MDLHNITLKLTPRFPGILTETHSHPCMSSESNLFYLSLGLFSSPFYKQRISIFSIVHHTAFYNVYLTLPFNYNTFFQWTIGIPKSGKTCTRLRLLIKYKTFHYIWLPLHLSRWNVCECWRCVEARDCNLISQCNKKYRFLIIKVIEAINK